MAQYPGDAFELIAVERNITVLLTRAAHRMSRFHSEAAMLLL